MNFRIHTGSIKWNIGALEGGAFSAEKGPELFTALFLSVLGGGKSGLFFEQPAEIERIVISNDGGDFCDIVICGF